MANGQPLSASFEDAQAGAFKTVIVHKFDRWARNTELLLTTIRHLTEKNIAFVSISEQVDCSTPTGKMTLTIIASTAQFHSDNLSVEVRKGILEKVQQGLWHGPYPIGYQKGPDGVLIASEAVEIVRLAFQLYATGQYSYNDVAIELNRRGFRMYNVQRAILVLFDKWNVLVILNNPVYRGFVKYKEQLFPGRHEPLVDAETWEKVQAIMARHGAKRGRVSMRGTLDGGGLLTELAYCEHCGRRMHHHSSTSKSGKRKGYYRCAGCDKLVCTAPGVRVDEVDAQMREFAGLLTIPSEWHGEVLDRAERLVGHADTASSPEREAVEHQLAVLENTRQCGLIVGADYEEKRRALEVKLAELAPVPVAGPTKQELRAAAELLGNLPGLLAAAPLPEQRGIMRRCAASSIRSGSRRTTCVL